MKLRKKDLVNNALVRVSPKSTSIYRGCYGRITYAGKTFASIVIPHVAVDAKGKRTTTVVTTSAGGRVADGVAARFKLSSLIRF